MGLKKNAFWLHAKWFHDTMRSVIGPLKQKQKTNSQYSLVQLTIESVSSSLKYFQINKVHLVFCFLYCLPHCYSHGLVDSPTAGNETSQGASYYEQAYWEKSNTQCVCVHVSLLPEFIMCEKPSQWNKQHLKHTLLHLMP